MIDRSTSCRPEDVDEEVGRTGGTSSPCSHSRVISLKFPFFCKTNLPTRFMCIFYLFLFFSFFFFSRHSASTAATPRVYSHAYGSEVAFTRRWIVSAHHRYPTDRTMNHVHADG